MDWIAACGKLRGAARPNHASGDRVCGCHMLTSVDSRITLGGLLAALPCSLLIYSLALLYDKDRKDTIASTDLLIDISCGWLLKSSINPELLQQRYHRAPEGESALGTAHERTPYKTLRRPGAASLLARCAYHNTLNATTQPLPARLLPERIPFAVLAHQPPCTASTYH